MAKIPDLSPLRMPDLICPNCSGTLRPKIEKTAKGKFMRAVFFCDGPDCQYAFEPSLEHAMGTFSGVKYESPDETKKGGKK